MQTRILSMTTLALLAATSSLFTACSDDTEPSSTQSATSSNAASSTGAGGSGQGGGDQGGGDQGGAGQGGAGGAGGGGEAKAETVFGFDPMKGEFVEGLDYDKGTAYVGALLTGVVFSVDVTTKQAKVFGNMPPFAQNEAALVGLVRGPDGAIYGALNATSPNAPKTGVYRIDPAGGEAKLFASNAGLKFGNDLRFDDAGNLYISDSVSGAIFKISKDGSTVTQWVQDQLLMPDPAVCGVQTDFHLGINGFVRRGDAYYATNTDRASIVKIPVNADGSAGKPEVFVATDCAKLSGVDGITVDPKTQDLLIAVNYQDRIIRVKADKSIEEVFKGEPLQSPASVVVDTEHSKLLVTSAAFAALAVDPTKAKPSLVSLPLP